VSHNGESPFQQIFILTSEKVQLSRHALLAWIAASDGEITSDEHKLLQEIANPRQHSTEFHVALEAARTCKSDELVLACETMRDQPLKTRTEFLRYAVMVAIADRKFTTTENYLLRFYSDLTGIAIDSIYQDLAGHPLPLPGDPSSLPWWDAYELDAASKERRKTSSQSTLDEMSRKEALSILGLPDDAQENEIRKSYHRLASKHHPDRFVDLGPNAEKAAAKKFSRIKDAYEILSTN